MRQAKLHVISVPLQKAEAACARGEGRPRAQLSRTGARKPGVTADPQVNARKGKKNGAGVPRGSGTGQEGRPCPRGPPLAQRIKRHLPPQRTPRQAGPAPPCAGQPAAGGRPATLAEAGRQQTEQRRPGCSLEAWRVRFYEVKPRNTARSARFALPFLMPTSPVPLLCIGWELSPNRAVFSSFPSSQDTWKFLPQDPATPQGDRGQAALPRAVAHCPWN